MKHLVLIIFGLLMSATAPAQTLYDFTMKGIDGADVPLSDYSGKVVLIVNVATFCGYTPQYEPLEKLYQQFKGRGLVVLGFPANDFGAQEPGTDEEIQDFCSSTYQVTFPMCSKITVKGDDKHALFAWLTSGAGNDALAGEIRWNFEKFLIDATGNLVQRFGTRTEPDATEVVDAISAELAR